MEPEKHNDCIQKVMEMSLLLGQATVLIREYMNSLSASVNDDFSFKKCEMFLKDVRAVLRKERIQEFKEKQ